MEIQNIENSSSENVELKISKMERKDSKVYSNLDEDITDRISSDPCEILTLEAALDLLKSEKEKRILLEAQIHFLTDRIKASNPVVVDVAVAVVVVVDVVVVDVDVISLIFR